MNKVATYLQEHIQGEVAIDATVLDAMSRDASVLQQMPEMVVYPAVTNDIRKVVRFAWQLAEKGHTLSLTPRGSGGDRTGGAIGKGVVVSLPAHMNGIYELAAKQKLLRVQPGASIQSINVALGLQGMAVAAFDTQATQATIGGLIASDAATHLSGKYGTAGDWVYQLEVVLSSGDVIQTGRLKKHEVSKKKGLQTLEGEIYRGVDALIDENQELIARLAEGVGGNAGYAIAKVKQKDGSIDLAPLFIGSQGTLGILSEMIIKVDFASSAYGVAVIPLQSMSEASGIAEQLSQLSPAFVDYFSASLFNEAAAQGKKYPFEAPAGALLVAFDDFNERARQRQLKKIEKLFKKSEIDCIVADGDDAAELLSLRHIVAFAHHPSGRDVSAPPIMDSVSVPLETATDFLAGIETLAAKSGTVLHVHGSLLAGCFSVRPVLQLQKVTDKQKIFKLLEEVAALASSVGGNLVGPGGEGRLKARAAYGQLDDDAVKLFGDIKTLFDPYNVLNPGVKQQQELRQLAGMVRSRYGGESQALHYPCN